MDMNHFIVDPFTRFPSNWKSVLERFDPKDYEGAHFGLIDYIITAQFDLSSSFSPNDNYMVCFPSFLVHVDCD